MIELIEKLNLAFKKEIEHKFFFFKKLSHPFQIMNVVALQVVYYSK